MILDSIKLKGAKLDDEIILAATLNNVVKNIDISEDGVEISGDVGIMQHDLNVLSGNYIQTSVSDQVTNYASKNAFIQADVDPHYGDSYAGSKAFCVLGLSSATNQIKLSGDIQVLKDIVDGRLSVGDMHVDINKSNSLRNVFGRRDAIKNETNMSSAMFSLTIDSHATSMTFHLSAVDTSTGIVTLKEPITNGGFGAYNERPQEFFEDIWLNDDNAFYLVGFPELGNANIHNNFGQFVSGGSVRAIGRQTHAEGRDSIADIRYAHAEGSHCTAAQMASHAEGFGTFANKSFAHAEGERTIAEGQGSHAEGRETVASQLGSHAEGIGSLAVARGAHAEGTSVSAFSDSSHAEGYKTEARGLYSHAEGREAVASGPHSHAEGYNTYATGKQSHASGFKTEAKGENSFTAGENSQALAAANNAFVIGRYSRANDRTGRNSFVWQGKYDDTNIYDSNRHGSFNINPQDGLSGFYIGNANFIQCVLSAVQSMDDTQKNALKTALGL